MTGAAEPGRGAGRARRTVRIAGAAADGEPWLIAEQPGRGADGAGLLAELVGPGARGAGARAPGGLVARRGGRAGAGDWPAGRAAARARCRSPRPPPRPGVVLDVGHTGTEVTRLAADGSAWLPTPSGRRRRPPRTRRWPRGAASTRRPTGSRAPVGSRRSDRMPVRPLRRRRAGWTGRRAPPAGGRRRRRRGGCGSGCRCCRRSRPDLATRAGSPSQRDRGRTRCCAEPLRRGRSSCVARGARRDGPALPVLLIGGVARAPLLAELLDAAGCADVAVAPRPDAAAVLGALRCPRQPSPAGSAGEPRYGRRGGRDRWTGR